MPLIQADFLLRDTMTKAFAEVREQPSLLDEIFAGRPKEVRLQIRDFFSGTKIKGKMGYPREASQLPGVYVLIGSADEDIQTIGSTLGERRTFKAYVEQAGAFFRTKIRLACWSTNPDECVYLQNIALWGLLKDRELLNKLDLAEQKVQIADLEPLPRWFPDLVFRRDVVLSALIPQTVSVTVPEISGVNVTPTVEGSVHPTITITN